MKKRIAAVLAVFAVSVGAGAEVASAQPEQNGLVNVYVDDVLNNNNIGVGVAANVAAEICGVQAQVGVLAQQVARGGQAVCTSDQGSVVRIDQQQ